MTGRKRRRRGTIGRGWRRGCDRAIDDVVDADELRPLLRSQIETKLTELARENYQGAKIADELEAKLAAAKVGGSHPESDSASPTPAALAELAAWANQALGLSINAEDLGSMTPARDSQHAAECRRRPLPA